MSLLVLIIFFVIRQIMKVTEKMNLLASRMEPCDFSIGCVMCWQFIYSILLFLSRHLLFFINCSDALTAISTFLSLQLYQKSDLSQFLSFCLWRLIHRNSPSPKSRQGQINRAVFSSFFISIQSCMKFQNIQ